jgi:methyl-accepting chemotaxis protein
MTVATAAEQLSDSIREISAQVSKSSGMASKAARDEQLANFDKVDAALDEAIANYSELRPDRAEITGAISGLVADYRNLRDQELIPAVQEGDLTRYQDIRAEIVVPVSDKIMATIGEDVSQLANEASEQRDSAAAEISRANWTVVAVLLLALVLAVFVSVVTIRSITNPLKAISRAIAALAVGDLTQRSGHESRDELGKTAADIDAALDVLTSTLTSFTVTAGEVRTAASSVELTAKAIVVQAESSAQDAAKVAAAGVQLDANVSTLAATGVEMGATIADVARSASTASNTAASATLAAEAASSTIRRLGESSRQIAEVTELIASIAAR